MFDQKSLIEVEKLSLSNNTVPRRIDEISEWVEYKLIKRVNLSTWFSLQLDESTDMQGLSQMIDFKKDCHEKESSLFRLSSKRYEEITVKDHIGAGKGVDPDICGVDEMVDTEG
ncbi:Hypothetical protein CINCED_3A014153 [Cinara cedri]|uniref:Uncharacterized protein n=1 Tax=Cinara cedri TaxID=506608 RepID=A0A5E4NNK9_9HEMI|nr:Hypothetical protein CINCED_3A014153 [Cinara cedri]